MDYKFKMGEAVTMNRSFLNRNAAGQTFEVTRLLPERDGELQYRIKGGDENHERVVRESELNATEAVSDPLAGR